MRATDLTDGKDMPLAQICCLIPQDDLLLAGLTPRETLQYSAKLRDVPIERVDIVLDILGLTKCANTRVGSPTGTRCLSGANARVINNGEAPLELQVGSASAYQSDSSC